MSAEPPSSEPGRYANAMRRAVAFTRELGCTARADFVPVSTLVNTEFSEIIREWARLNICSQDDRQVAGMCMRITYNLVEFLQGAGIDAIYTLGWMSYGDHPVYRFDRRDVARWLSDGIPASRRVDVHAWATLPSAEIVDPSWLSTVGIVQNKRELIGAVIIADAEQKTKHQYHPVTVDIPLLLQIGLLNFSQGELPRQAPPPAELLAQIS